MLRRFQFIVFGSALLVALIIGGGVVFGSAVAHTSKTEFCISCHEMEDTVYQEYKKTKHYKNESGVRASCSDCHVPRSMSETLVRKIKAVKDIYHHLMGSIDSIEKFEDKRLMLAQRVWRTMEENNSLECRNCHQFDAMQLSEQRRRARMQHKIALVDHKTCIDCHKGIAHKPVHQDAAIDNDQVIDLSLEF